jgi:hypothetical protein
MALSARIYAPITGAWEAPGGGRKKKSKKLSHRLLRKYFKRETKKEITPF